jgi:hypothetical protein
MFQNPNCDGQGMTLCSSAPEVRVLPLGGHGNLILCREHWNRELRWRRERNRELADDVRYGLPACACRYDLPAWETGKAYDPVTA